MKLTSENLKFLHDTAVVAARKAGDIIRSFQDKPLDVRHKTTGDTLASQVVTEIDLRSEKAILGELQNSRDQFDLGMLTEEQGDDGSRLVKDYFWCVDPIDGTLSFVEGVAGYAVSIGLVSKAGKTLIGVVYDPVTDTLYSAIYGQGVWKNGTPWKQSSVSASTDPVLTLVCDRSLETRSFFSELIDQFEVIAKQIGAAGLQIHYSGGAVMNACQVLEKPPACYFKIPKSQQGGGSLWDFAATVCLFQEKGAMVTDYHGNSLALNRSDTTFMNEQGVIFASDERLAESIKSLSFTQR